MGLGGPFWWLAGKAIGALLGSNPVAAVVGGAVGAAATVLIGLASGLLLLFNGFSVATPAAASTRESGYFLTVPVAAVLY